MEATTMVNSVQVLLLGMVIISAIGTIFGYLLEPGRFEKREAAERAVNVGAELQTQSDGSPRLAA
jgi:hypothetical protein